MLIVNMFTILYENISMLKKKHLRKQTIGCELSSEELLMEWKFKYSYDLGYFQVFAPERKWEI